MLSKLTRGGIALLLNESPFEVIHAGIVLKFSSALYMNKFLRQINSYVNNQKMILASQYKIKMDCLLNTQIATIKLYNQIEKRGFYIIVEGVKYNTWQPVKCNGLTVIIKNYKTNSGNTTDELQK